MKTGKVDRHHTPVFFVTEKVKDITGGSNREGRNGRKTKKKKEQKQTIKQVKCSFHQSTDGLSAALINTEVDKINKLKAAETFLNSDICNVMMSSSANCCYECACVSEFKSRSVSRSPLFLRRDVLLS